MTKKPTFLPPRSNTPKSNAPNPNFPGNNQTPSGSGDTADVPGADPAVTRLYHDPAEAAPITVPAPPPAEQPAPTRILRPTPKTDALGAAGAASVTRVLETPAGGEPAPSDPSSSGRTQVLGAEPVVEKRQSNATAPNAVGAPAAMTGPIAGWLVIVDGPGRGKAAAFAAGMNAIGAGTDNDIVLDYGDEDITEDAHAYIVYDEETRTFHATHAGQNAVVRLNNKPLLEATDVANAATLRIGKTSLRLVTLCGPDFDWSDS